MHKVYVIRRFENELPQLEYKFELPHEEFYIHTDWISIKGSLTDRQRDFFDRFIYSMNIAIEYRGIVYYPVGSIIKLDNPRNYSFMFKFQYTQADIDFNFNLSWKKVGF